MMILSYFFKSALLSPVQQPVLVASYAEISPSCTSREAERTCSTTAICLINACGSFVLTSMAISSVHGSDQVIVSAPGFALSRSHLPPICRQIRNAAKAKPENTSAGAFCTLKNYCFSKITCISVPPAVTSNSVSASVLIMPLIIHPLKL